MDNILREILKTKIVSFKGTAFQTALDRIYHCVYGDIGFQRIKQKKDGGSDGVLHGTTVLAAYAPENYSLGDFKKKIGNDFQSYGHNWEATHPFWQVVTNLESTAQMVQFVHELKIGAPVVCIESLLQLIAAQTWTVKLSILRALDIPERYLANDVLSTVIEDLIQLSDDKLPFNPYAKPTYIVDKIGLNVLEEHRDSFMDEYEESLPFFPIVAHIIQSRSQENVAAIRNKVRATFSSLSGTFEQKMYGLVNTMSAEKNNDDFYKHNMRLVMLYFFEQCLYGIKANQEVSHD
jgi:hypothetical protein